MNINNSTYDQLLYDVRLIVLLLSQSCTYDVRTYVRRLYGEKNMKGDNEQVQSLLNGIQTPSCSTVTGYELLFIFDAVCVCVCVCVVSCKM